MFYKFFKLTLIWNPIRNSIRKSTNLYSFNNLLKNSQPTQCSLLDNGLIVATEERGDSCNTSIGLYIDAGSRYERNSENGIAHFFEHVVFKGTTSTCKTDLEDLISGTGAKFKSVTTREVCAYYAECLSEDINTITGILFDSVYKNALCAPEIEIQKKTVYEEMIRHDKLSGSVLFDYLHSTAFQGIGLGQTVMGPSLNLYNFKAESITKYLRKHHIPQRTILAAVGCVKHEQMVNLGNSYFDKMEAPEPILLGPCRYTGSEITYRDDSMHVAHVAIAVEGPCYCSGDRLTMELAGMVLGGWDRSQPGGIHHHTRAARAASSGLADCYKAFNFFYQDTGLWGTQFISPRLEVDDMLAIVQDEWMRLCNIITDSELVGPKWQLKSKILSRLESATAACHDIGTWVSYTGRRPTLEERFYSIDKITAGDLKKVCTKYIYDKCPAIVSIGSTECLPEYNRTRAGMYWLRI